MDRKKMLLTVLRGGNLRYQYLLRDLFTTDRAAGTVSTTASEPGPGVRGVVDTAGSNVSITGGEIVIAAGTGAWNQSAWWLTPAVSRAAGRVFALRGKITKFQVQMWGVTGAANGINTNYDNLGYSLIATTGALKARRASDTLSPTIYTILLNTVYTFYTVTRTSGKFMLLDDGADVYLLWCDDWGTGANLYPGTSVYHTGGANAFTSVATPDKFYLIPALASDSFNRDDGAIGSTDGAGHLEAIGGSGKTWVQVGTWAVAANKAACSTLDAGTGVATVDAGATDVFVSAKITRAAGSVGLVARWADTSNHIRMYYDGTNVKIDQVSGGTVTNLVAAARSNVANSRMSLRVIGTSVFGFYDDNGIGAGYTANGAGVQNGTRCGLYTTDTGNAFDDFAAFAAKGYTDLRSY